MDTQDEYVFYDKEDGARFYFKNKKLHREAGPAIVVPNEREKYINLIDESLYKPIPVVKTQSISSQSYYEDVFSENGSVYRPNLIYNLYAVPKSEYYLDGTNYPEKKFNVLVLKNQLENQLGQQQNTTKKTKI